MENYLTYSKEVIETLSDNFEEFEFHFYVQDIGVIISVFLIQGLEMHFQDNEAWRKISEEIALGYQSKIKSAEDKWNVYVIYVFTDKAQKSLKSKIENDKFSSRKIVVDNLHTGISDKMANKIISEKITNSDLTIKVEEAALKVEESYVSSNTKIWDNIPTHKLISGDVKL